MAETEKHDFSSPAGQQRQQENDSIASTPTISSDPPLPTGLITKKREDKGVLPMLLDIILPLEATDVVKGVPKPKCARTARAIRKENRRENCSCPKGWGDSCNKHQQKYLVKKNREMAAVLRERDYRIERHTIVKVQSQTGDKCELCLRSIKVCRNSPRYMMMLRVLGNVLMGEKLWPALEKVKKR